MLVTLGNVIVGMVLDVGKVLELNQVLEGKGSRVVVTTSYFDPGPSSRHCVYQQGLFSFQFFCFHVFVESLQFSEFFECRIFVMI